METRKHYKISSFFFFLKKKQVSKYWDWEDISVGKVLRARVWASSIHVNAG